MKCDRCFKEVERGKKIPHPISGKMGFFLIFCDDCAEETGNKNAETIHP